MATVIFSNFGDTDTKVLAKLWEGLENVKVVEIKPTTINPRKKVDEAIAEEEDLLIMCGHGYEYGLYEPNMSGRYLIDRDSVDLIRAEKVVGVFCYAEQFAWDNDLHGFFSGMFISNVGEAKLFKVPYSDQKSITDIEIRFCNDVCRVISSDVPMDHWIEYLKEQVDMDDPVVKYNYNGLAYYE